ncbi:hypothetical protein AVEN_254015-1 [Araneus ventricosus]|uniref:Uncharacterized protein n=1 Tax=Araneus ventricosus TaxID=182803 RepID=A0A4Y2E6G9_ARAVE|nr:hypothetical protein AVEN_254015-1 [Araneus ventricosus]
MESSLACRLEKEGINKKAEGLGKGKLERRKDPLVPRDWDTHTHLKKPEWHSSQTFTPDYVLRKRQSFKLFFLIWCVYDGRFPEINSLRTGPILSQCYEIAGEALGWKML